VDLDREPLLLTTTMGLFKSKTKKANRRRSKHRAGTENKAPRAPDPTVAQRRSSPFAVSTGSNSSHSENPLFDTKKQQQPQPPPGRKQSDASVGSMHSTRKESNVMRLSMGRVPIAFGRPKAHSAAPPSVEAMLREDMRERLVLFYQNNDPERLASGEINVDEILEWALDFPDPEGELNNLLRTKFTQDLSDFPSGTVARTGRGMQRSPTSQSHGGLNPPTPIPGAAAPVDTTGLYSALEGFFLANDPPGLRNGTAQELFEFGAQNGYEYLNGRLRLMYGQDLSNLHDTTRASDYGNSSVVHGGKWAAQVGVQAAPSSVLSEMADALAERNRNGSVAGGSRRPSNASAISEHRPSIVSPELQHAFARRTTYESAGMDQLMKPSPPRQQQQQHHQHQAATHGEGDELKRAFARRTTYESAPPQMSQRAPQQRPPQQQAHVSTQDGGDELKRAFARRTTYESPAVRQPQRPHAPVAVPVAQPVAFTKPPPPLGRSPNQQRAAENASALTCRKYSLDFSSTSFGVCKCGFPKTQHSAEAKTNAAPVRQNAVPF
jgi:hypothetical protein